MIDWTEVQWNPRRIAIFRALQLGDLLLAVPALRAIRADFPGAEITLIGLPWAQPFVRRLHSYVDRFVEFVGFPGIAEVDVVPERTACFVEEQQAYGYDLVIQMHGSGRTSNRFALALGSRMTVGYYEDKRPEGLTLGAPYPDDQPEVYRNLGLAIPGSIPNWSFHCAIKTTRRLQPYFAECRVQIVPGLDYMLVHVYRPAAGPPDTLPRLLMHLSSDSMHK